MFKNKFISLSALLFMSAGLLTGCGAGGGNSDGTKIVTIWVHKNESEDEGKVYKQIQTNFNNANIVLDDGTKLKVNTTFVGTSLEDKINASIITGGLPDIIAVDSSEVASKVNNGLLKDFGSYVTDEEKNSYVDSVIEQGTINGKLYTLSGMEAPGGLYYNKAMLRSVGYTDADFGTLENPWSFKDVKEAMVKLKNAGKSYQIALNQSFGTDGEMYLYSSLVYSAGGSFGTENNVSAALTSDNAVKGIAQLEMFFTNDGLTGTESWVYSGSNSEAFRLEQIPFQIHGPWDARKIKKNGGSIADDYGIMPYPVYEDENGNKSAVFASPCGSYGFGITKDCKNVKAAAEVVKYFTNATSSKMMYDAIGTYPTHKSLLSDMDEFKSGVEKDLASYLQANTYTRPKMVKYARLKDAYAKVIDYMKNMNTVSNYNLKNYIKVEMDKVDQARS